MSASGKFILRIPPALHRRLQQLARVRGLSLNETCRSLLEEATGAGEKLFPHQDVLSRAEPWLREMGIIGVVLFGSQARGTASTESDTDLLLVLPPDTEPRREMYRAWDERSGFSPSLRVEPHFASLPDEGKAGSLWLEVALEGRLLWASDASVASRLAQLRDRVARGDVQRHYSHGHPYWIRKGVPS